MSEKRMTPLLVLVDTKTLMYKRYRGHACVLKCQANQPLTQAEVETFRMFPDSMLPPDEPQAG